METERSRLRRFPHRARYDRSEIDPIIDAGLMAHVGLVIEGDPVVWPTLHARVGDKIFLHGSSASRPVMAVKSAGELPACVTITILDGLVFARSALQHSLNYRSVMLYGNLRLVPAEEHLATLRSFTDVVLPGRWEHTRSPSPKEQAMTGVLSFEIVEGAAKVRSGPPEDLEEDMESPGWAGELPIRSMAERPITGPGLMDDAEVPQHIVDIANQRLDGIMGPHSE